MPFPNETPRWRRYLRFWRRDVQGDIDDELGFHFQARIDELVAQGLSPESARARTLEEFGDPQGVRRDLRAIDERIARRERRAEVLQGWWQDCAYAWRSIRRTPGVTIAIVATLALGLGANTAMFSFLNAVFLKPPSGVVHPEQVRRLWTYVPFRNGPRFWSGYDYVQYQAMRSAIGPLGRTALYRRPAPVRIGRGVGADRAMMSQVSGDFLPLLGVHAAIGRLFAPDEDRLGTPVHVAVVSDGYWRRALGGDTAAIGRDIVLSGTPYTVIGVAAPAFTGIDLDATDVWVPLASMGSTSWWTNRNVNGFQIVLRLADGAGDDAIGARTTQALHRAHLDYMEDDSTSVTRTGSIIYARGPGKMQQEVQIATRLGGVALIVLLIACANVVNLLLARAVRRKREIAMRLALGVPRGRLARLILTESVLLALFAGVAAIAVAQWGGRAIRALLLPSVHWAHAPVDWRVLAGAVAVTLLAGLAAGAVPAVQSGSTDLNEVLKAGAREGFVRRSRARSALVVVQAALSVTLLVGATLFVRSLSNVRALDLGFDADHLVYAHVDFDKRDARRDSLTPARLEEVANRLRTLPAVEHVALTFMRPMGGFSIESYYPDADTIAHPKPSFSPLWTVSSGWFATQGTRVLMGHDFAPTGRGATPPSVIVNLAMAQALWPGESPIGRCVRFVRPDGRCNAVIGVVENAHWGEVIEDPTPQFYLPLDNLPFNGRPAGTLAVRAEPAQMAAVVTSLRSALREAFPDGVPIVERMSSSLEPKYRPWRLGATLFTMFGVLAALVAALGVYSTVSYGVSLRTHEFGVRAALGATSGEVVRYVVADGLRTVLVGIAAGIVLSLAAGRLVASLLYGISPEDPGALVAVAAGLLLVAALAMLFPAWRAARVDPVTALRVE